MANEQEINNVSETKTVEYEEAERFVEEVAGSQEQFYREKSTSSNEQKPSKIDIVKDFLRECKRVLLVTKKPDKAELKMIVKISGLGILIIGLLGFLIHMAKELLFK